jgi:Tol biopolymer transport system component/predicted Ser/Thr protein kinase
MAVAIGTRFGVYEITGQIGVGGMGEVYRATDTKLGREVAIKTLPSALAQDTNRLARFEREAKLLAALNHAHIAAIYGLDEHEGAQFIAMELVEGVTLEEKLKAGSLRVEEALHLALQIAEALEAAHGKGVVHRDLKPANIMITPDGVVKVLDFGLAKAFSGDPNEVSPTYSPALSLAMTQQGLILGTAGYMSPEQAAGQATDQRTDIWAFGVVLYEMLTGLPLFSGESVQHILADVLKTEPDWSRLPGNLHPRLKLLLERCLTKKPRNRYHSIADARVDIESILSDPEGSLLQQAVGAPAAARSFWHRALVPLGALIVGGAIVGFGFRFVMPTERQPVNRFDFDLPANQEFNNPTRAVMALSPDGRNLVYAASDGLYVRRMGVLEPQPIVGSDARPVLPFFSVDGQWVGYFTLVDRQIKRVSITGGAPVVVGEWPEFVFGASWGPDNNILFAGESGIWRVSANAGTPELIIEAKGDESFHGPRLLPDGDSVLFTVSSNQNWDRGKIVAESLSTGERKVLVEGGTDARHVQTGHLVYAFEDDLFAVAFDIDTLSVRGGAAPVAQGVMRSFGNTGAANFDISNDGTLVYVVRGASAEGGLSWVDREGREESIPIGPNQHAMARLSPDGTRVALDDRAPNVIWIYTFASGTRSLLNTGDDQATHPTWTPGGDRVAYASASRGIGWKASNNTGDTETVAAALIGRTPIPYFFVPDGTAVVYLDRMASDNAESDIDIDMIAIGADAESVSLLNESHLQLNAALSPSGQWIAYESNETGEFEVYVRPFPNVDDNVVPISNAGGTKPAWSPDGRELYYIAPGETAPRLVAATVEKISDIELSVVDRAPLFDYTFDTFAGINGAPRPYDVASDGRFLIPTRAGRPQSEPARIIIVENWFEELRRLVPTD